MTHDPNLPEIHDEACESVYEAFWFGKTPDYADCQCSWRADLREEERAQFTFNDINSYLRLSREEYPGDTR